MIGMVYALYLSQTRLGLDFDMKRYIQWVQGLGYGTTIQEICGGADLLSLMKRDKKTVSEMVTFVLIEKVGHPIMKNIPDSEILKSLSYMYEQK